MVYTAEQIELEVSQCGGTWVKRRNLRAKLVDGSNKAINERIGNLKKEIRALKAAGVKQQALATVYSIITKLEMRLL